MTFLCRHFDEAVRAFVVKRIETWAQSTQIAVQMHTEDIAFQQRECSAYWILIEKKKYREFLENLSDSSSSSYDAKVQRFGNSAKSSPSPPTNSVPKMFKKHSKTPLHDHHSGSVTNAALVPQTDIQSRYRQRRRRNSSSSSSGIRRPGERSIRSSKWKIPLRFRLALFGKPSDYFFSRANDYPRSRYSPIKSRYSIVCLSKVNFCSPWEIQSNENGFSLIKTSHLQMEKEYSFGEIHPTIKSWNLLLISFRFERTFE